MVQLEEHAHLLAEWQAMSLSTAMDGAPEESDSFRATSMAVDSHIASHSA